MVCVCVYNVENKSRIYGKVFVSLRHVVPEIGKMCGFLAEGALVRSAFVCHEPRERLKTPPFH